MALVFAGWAFIQKLNSPTLAAEANGVFFGFGNGLVGFLLITAALLWVAGFALLVMRRLA
jgi:hypothetical protein